MDTETTCHCGAAYNGSDHCPSCGCEQYESAPCAYRHEVGQDDCCPCRECWAFENERARESAFAGN